MEKSEDDELERLKKEKMKEIMAKKQGSEFPESPLRVTDSNFQNIVDEYPIIVVDFWAEWCSACKPMSPLIERMAEKYSGKIVFGKLNIDKNPKITNRFQITSIPTLLFIKNGSAIDKVIGTISPKQLEQKLKKYLD